MPLPATTPTFLRYDVRRSTLISNILYQQNTQPFIKYVLIITDSRIIEMPTYLFL